jgi:hypothetical protein
MGWGVTQGLLFHFKEGSINTRLRKRYLLDWPAHWRYLLVFCMFFAGQTSKNDI